MKIYNTLAGEKQEFIPVEPGKVRMYVCGPTVYDHIHIGNARPFVFFDVVRRYLEYKGYQVTYIQNYTDIDDKIIQKAIDQEITTEQVTAKYIAEVEKDADRLMIQKASYNPKATEEIDEIIDMIADLVDKGYAYVVDGTVYFESGKFENYGRLANKKIEDLEAGKRIAVEQGKRNPSDFVLWKPKKENEPYWDSPWSQGRPGWHIECSAMARKYLGKTIDIHAGGSDLVFPHHENEIAQSECANNAKFANYWMHNGFINVDNQKMSKSKGNFFTIPEIAQQFSYPVIRFFLLNAQYRSPINFSQELMASAQASLERIQKGYQSLVELADWQTEERVLTGEELRQRITADPSLDTTQIMEFIQLFEAGMEDDFNSSLGISTIFQMVKYINTELADKQPAFIELFGQVFVNFCKLLGIAYQVADQWLPDQEIEALIEKRNQARANKDFKLADQIRADLLERGIGLEDTRQGVKYYRNK